MLALKTWRARTAVVFAAALLGPLIGLSRMYLGAHYFSDVLAGHAAGACGLDHGRGDGPARQATI
jgi:membrane-associated phospholipid phosphatase